MANKKTLIFFGILIVLSVLTSYLAIRDREGNALNPNSNNLPAMIASRLEVRQMAADGSLSYYFSADGATEYGENLYNLEHISGAIYNNQGPPWLIAADHGKITDANSKMFLWGGVNAHRTAYATVPALAFDTNSLTLYVNQRFAETADPVKFSQPGSGNSMSATGMQASMVSQTVKLLSKVDSYYVPIKANS